MAALAAVVRLGRVGPRLSAILNLKDSSRACLICFIREKGALVLPPPSYFVWYYCCTHSSANGQLGGSDCRQLRVCTATWALSGLVLSST